jgi:predicted nucleic acid-binding protein
VRILTEKFDLTADEIFKIIADIQQNGRHVDITSDESPVLNDLADNLFINLAIDGGAKIIISGDSHLLKLRSFKTITIINVAEFLRMG